LPNAVSAAAAAAGHTTVPARAAPQCGCVGRHLANTNELRVSGSDSYALLFLFESVLASHGVSLSNHQEFINHNALVFNNVLVFKQIQFHFILFF